MNQRPTQTLSQQLRTTLSLAPQQLQLMLKLEKNDAEMRDDALNELEANPALELAEDSLAAEQNKTEDGEAFTETAEQVQDGDYGSDDDIPPYRLRINNRSDEDSDYRAPAVAEETLSEYLMAQLLENEELTPTQEVIAQYVIDNLEDSGYLTRSAAGIADDVTFKADVTVDTAQVEEVIEMVRELDPPGIAAHDLRDCLLLQIERLRGNEVNRTAYALVDRCFDSYLQGGRLPKIVRELQVSDELLAAAIAVVRHLNPKPASAFAGDRSEERVQQIKPDFEVRVEDGRVSDIALVNTVPELQVSQSFADGMRLLESTGKAGGEAAYIRDNYEQARNYLNLLKMRQEKLYATIWAIVNRQREYFITGDETSLVPMGLKDIAADTGMDESVLSRATRNKWVDTPWGIKPLRFFFHEAMGHSSGEAVTAINVQEALKRIVENEDKTSPLTDEQLCERLRAEGFHIERRTVSKYRVALGFPTARRRRVGSTL